MDCSATHAFHSLLQLRVPALLCCFWIRWSWLRVVGLFVHIYAGCAALIASSSAYRPLFIAILRTLLLLWSPLRTFSYPFAPSVILVLISQKVTLIDFELAVNHIV